MLCTVSRWAFIGLLGLLALLIAESFLPDYKNKPEIGCYWTADLVFYVECRGFAGTKVIGFLLTLPNIVFFYAPIFLWEELKSDSLAEFAAKHPLVVLFQVVFVCWLALGVAYFIIWLLLRARRIVKAVFDDLGQPGA